MPGRPAWRTVLQRVQKAFGEQRQRVEEQADLLLNHLQQRHTAAGTASNSALPELASVLQAQGEAHPFAEGLPAMAEGLLRDADRAYGGFGQAPKFPSAHALRFQLRYAVAQQHVPSLQHALDSLEAMARGGIHDHLGGGFARYATDRAWLVPHFEKMLYDNALLLSAFSEAAQADRVRREAAVKAGAQPEAAEAVGASVFAGQAEQVVRGIVDWATRAMRHPDGGFYATLDADSLNAEGRSEEGAFYTWSMAELRQLLGADADLFARAYGARDPGWWEGRNILYRAEALPDLAKAEGLAIPDLAKAEGLAITELEKRLARARQILFEHRAGRPHPGLDNKVILAWNALFCSGLFRAEAAFGEATYAGIARQALDFLDQHLADGQGGMHHVWQEGRARFPAYLDDLAAYACACIDAADAAPDHSEMAHRLHQAGRAMAQVLEQFSAAEGPWFYYTPKGQTDVVARTIDRYDGATPSANALAADALLRLGRLLDRPAWTERGLQLVDAIRSQAKANPGAFGYWGCCMIEEAAGREELVCIGPKAKAWRGTLRAQFRPGTLYAIAAPDREADRDAGRSAADLEDSPAGEWPLLAGRQQGPEGIYHCRNYACSAPVATPGDVQTWGIP